MKKNTRITQKRFLRLLYITALVAMLFSCNSSSTTGKFIGTWKRLNASANDRTAIIIERFGDNFRVKANIFDETDDRNRTQMTASYIKESNKLVVPGEYGSGTDIIYNSETNTILAWGEEFKKVDEKQSPITPVTNKKTDLIENNANAISVIATSIKVPITVAKINAVAGQYSSFTPEGDGDGSATYWWKLENGLVIKGMGGYLKPNLSDEIDFILFSAKDKNTPINCAFDLTLNKSNLDECKQKIGNLKKTGMGEYYYKFLKDKIYHYLHFDANSILIEIIKNSHDWENSGG